MDERRLYETILGLAEPWYVAEVEVAVGAEEIRVRLEPRGDATLVCPECGRSAPGYDRAEERRWRHLDTCQFRTIICARIPRVQCGEHGVRQVRVPWAEDRSRFTLLFEALAIRVLRETTVAGLAALLRLSWEEAQGIFQRAVARGLARRAREPVGVLGVDETSFQKRHEYVTVVADVKRGRVLWVGDHRRQETLEAFWDTLAPAERAGLEAVVMDMWEPYIAATRTALAEDPAPIVFDRYHVVQHLNHAVDLVRRAEQAELRERGVDDLKRTRYVWLKGAARRSPEDRQLIQQLRRAGYKVGRAWAIKEAAGKLWQYRSMSWALKYFRRWYGWAVRSRLAPVIRVAKMMKHYLAGILAYLRHPYTNALTEALNAKIQEIKYRARGYRNRENFRLAILFHCGGLDMNPC
ncbi:MAG: ISL3 family transposase [Gemmatimonadota bacterium]